MSNTDPYERGWLGNPYKVQPWGQYTREESVALFEKAFAAKLESDDEFRRAVEGLGDQVTLGCYCAPKLCHGNVVARYLNEGSLPGVL